MTQKFHPINGFPQDFDNFLKDFLEANSLRFRVFVELWKKHNFSFIICGRQKQKCLDDFLNCLFYQLVEFLQPPNEIETQVCAFYMLYGFYFKQPVKGRVRIRVTNREWQQILMLQAIMQREGHWDLVYIFHVLCSVKAFHFCATRQPYFPSVPFYPFISDENLPLNYGKPLSTIVGIQRLQMLDEIHSRYQYFKQKLPSQQQTDSEGCSSQQQNGIGLISDLNLVQSNFFTSLREKIFQDEEKMKVADKEKQESQLKSSEVNVTKGKSKEKGVPDDNIQASKVDIEDPDSEISEEETDTDDDNDDSWRTRGRRRARSSCKNQGDDDSDDELANLSIGERRVRLKNQQYGNSPSKSPAKRLRLKNNK